MTATDLKKRAIALAEKTKIDSVTPEEVGQLSNDIVEYIENVEINGSSLGIRKTYTSVSAMEADSTAPMDDKGVLLRRGMLVNIYNQDNPSSSDNGKVFSFQNPGWAFRGTVDAGYATKEELTELSDSVQSIDTIINGSEYYSITKDVTKGQAGVIVLETGEIDTSYQDSVSTLIPLNGCDAIEYGNISSYSGPTRTNIAIYDINGTYIAGLLPSWLTGEVKNGTIDITSYPNAKYLRVVTKMNTTPTLNLIFYEKTSIEEKFANVDEQLNSQYKSIADNKEKLTGSLMGKKTFFKKSDDSVYTISVNEESAITEGILYPILKDNTPNGEISDLYRFSTKMKVAGDSYPLYLRVTQLSPNKHLQYFVDFVFDGSEIELKLPPLEHVEIFCDGEYIGAATAGSDTSKLNYFVNINFGESKSRHITVTKIGYGCIANGNISKYEKSKLVIAYDGDSLVEGTAVIGAENDAYNWVSVCSQILGCDFINGGVGGSGYNTEGNLSQPNMVDRFDDYIKVCEPDILYSMAGLNDTFSDAWKIAVDSYWEHVKTVMGDKYVIVASPYNPSLKAIDNLIQMTDYLKNVALKNEFAFIDVINGKVYDTMGNIISDNPNGGLVNDNTYPILYKEFTEGTVEDGTHINNTTGHAYVGKYIASAIYKLCHYDLGF